MGKTITFRLDDDAAALLDERVQAAGVSRTDYLIGLLAGSASAPATVPESDRVRSMAARILALEATTRDLKDDVKEGRRAVQVESGSSLAGSKPKGKRKASLPAQAVSRIVKGRTVSEELSARDADLSQCIHPARWRRASLCLLCGQRRNEAGEWAR